MGGKIIASTENEVFKYHVPCAIKCAEVVLYASEERYRWLLDVSPDAALLHQDGLFVLVNDATVKLFGVSSSEQLIGKPIVNFIRLQVDPSNSKVSDPENLGINLLNGQIMQLNGNVLDVQVIEKYCIYQGKPSAQLVIRNLAEGWHLEPNLHFLVQYDGITKLPNHRQFRDLLSSAIARVARNQQKAAVVLLSIDQFNAMVARFGRQSGDFILQQTAGRIKQCMREGDMAVWLGEDEFSVILEGLSQRQGAAVMVQRLLTAMSLPLIYNDQEIMITVSVGIAVFADDANGMERLIYNAELALNHAKNRESSAYEFYTAGMDNPNTRNTLHHTEILHRYTRLTPREREVAVLLIAGHTNKAISNQLGISSRTVENHRAKIMDKMFADSIADLVRIMLVLQTDKHVMENV